MIISVASGKGGTGKTTIAVSLARSLTEKVQLLDCDVEEPNAHIFLKPAIEREEPVAIPVPRIDASKCTRCGRCAEVCAYNALAVLPDEVLVFPLLCHGCGGCGLLCPEGAITEEDKVIGMIQAGHSNGMEFIHGKINIGEVLSPHLIRAVLKRADRGKTVIIDAPPGTSCPVIAAVRGSDFCVLVTEPTPFGFNDLVLAVEVIRKLQIPFGVVINRSDIGDNKVEEYCRNEKIPVLMRVPFREEIAAAYSRGEVLVDAVPAFKDDFIRMREEIGRMA